MMPPCYITRGDAAALIAGYQRAMRDAGAYTFKVQAARSAQRGGSKERLRKDAVVAPHARYGARYARKSERCARSAARARPRAQRSSYDITIVAAFITLSTRCAIDVVVAARRDAQMMRKERRC